MKLIIDDKTDSAKPLYYQSLILLFLPCEKFGENDNENTLFVSAYREGGCNYVLVRLQVGDKTVEISDKQNYAPDVYAQMKNLIGRTIVRAASQMFGIVPPWGISTGVKPVKLARMFVKPFGVDEALRILCEEYMISPDKAKIAVDTCILEDNLMAKMGNNPCSLYISIPFCPTKCNYCSFVSCTTPRLLSLIPEYVKSLIQELDSVSKLINLHKLDLKSIYIGGGTPAILDAFQIDYLLSSVYSKFKVDDNVEFTFEAGRPDCITADKLKVLSNYGVGRISINTQTSNDEVLKAVGRNHSFADYLNSMDLAHKFNFKCINTDIIAGLPGETPGSFLKSVNDVISACPENITIHAFTLKKSSNYRISGEKGYSLDDSDAFDMTSKAYNRLETFGYNPYYIYRQKNTTGNLENIGFSKPGLESVYNIVMMGEYHTVFGVGAGSVTKIVSKNGEKVDRIFSPKYPYEFLDREKYKGYDINKVTKLLNER